MKKLMYVAALILALGFAACGSDDSVDCGEVNVKLSEAAVAYGANQSSTDICNEYRKAIEEVLNNNCSTDDDAKKVLEGELSRLGDCTFSGRKCIICTNSGIDLIICRGTDGNAYIQEKVNNETVLRDTGILFDRYVELSKCE